MSEEYKTRVPPFHAGTSFTDESGNLTARGADALNLLRTRTGGSDDFISEQQVIAIAQQQDNALVAPDGIVGAFFFALSERVDNLETRLSVATGEEALENGAGELTTHQVDQIKNIAASQNIDEANWEVLQNILEDTGWTAGTGTETKGGMDSDSSTTASVGYVQAEVQAINDDVVEARRVLQAMQAALTADTILGT